MTACLGVAHSRASTVFFSASAAGTFGYLAAEGGEFTDTPEEIDSKIRIQRELKDARISYVVVEGSEEFCRRYIRSLSEPDFVVFVSEEGSLEALGVPILDKDWKQGQRALTLDEVFSRFRR